MMTGCLMRIILFYDIRYIYGNYKNHEERSIRRTFQTVDRQPRGGMVEGQTFGSGV